MDSLKAVLYYTFLSILFLPIVIILHLKDKLTRK